MTFLAGSLASAAAGSSAGGLTGSQVLSAALPFAGEFLGGLFGGSDDADDKQRAINRQNHLMQKEFAKHAIRWKAADARAAGLHPLAVLGAQTIAATPSYVGADPSSPRSPQYSQLGKRIGSALAQLNLENSATELRRRRIAMEREELALARDHTAYARELGYRHGEEQDRRWTTRTRAMRARFGGTETDERRSRIRANDAAAYRDRHEGDYARDRPTGTRKRPHPLIEFYRDPYSNRVIPLSSETAAEATEGFGGKVISGYGLSQEGLESLFEGLR